MNSLPLEPQRPIVIILAAQDFDVANHRTLWTKMAEEEPDSLFIVVNIGADLVASVLRRRFTRLKEAFSEPVWHSSNLMVVRPFYLLRPELSPRILNRLNARLLRTSIARQVSGSKEPRILLYLGRWGHLARSAFPDGRLFYYIIDEVRLDAHSGEYNQERTRWDEYCCRRSEHVFLMTEELRALRNVYSSKLTVVGNGATQTQSSNETAAAPNTVGLLGNIRNWIDLELLEQLVRSRPDLRFELVGPVESDMRPFIAHLQTRYANIHWHGPVRKEEVPLWYSKFAVSIVPYKQNSFIAATRPLKIVESVFCGRRVVTVPMSGYQESSLVRFARSAEEFSDQINAALQDGPIRLDSEEAQEFIRRNDWDSVAARILALMRPAESVGREDISE